MWPIEKNGRRGWHDSHGRDLFGRRVGVVVDDLRVLQCLLWLLLLLFNEVVELALLALVGLWTVLGLFCSLCSLFLLLPFAFGQWCTTKQCTALPVGYVGFGNDDGIGLKKDVSHDHFFNPRRFARGFSGGFFRTFRFVGRVAWHEVLSRVVGGVLSGMVLAWVGLSIGS